jgi:hypothetical protein
MKWRKRKMIKKWIKLLIEKFFGKFCKCGEDEHITMYTEVPKSDIKVVCEKHPDSYKKTCPSCREAIA